MDDRSDIDIDYPAWFNLNNICHELLIPLCIYYCFFFSKFMLKCTNDIMSILIYITPQKPRRVQFLSRLKSSAPAAAQVSVAWGSSHLNNVIGRH